MLPCAWKHARRPLKLLTVSDLHQGCLQCISCPRENELPRTLQSRSENSWKGSPQSRLSYKHTHVDCCLHSSQYCDVWWWLSSGTRFVIFDPLQVWDEANQRAMELAAAPGRHINVAGATCSSRCQEVRYLIKVLCYTAGCQLIHPFDHPDIW